MDENSIKENIYSIEEKIYLLKSKGLIINDTSFARNCLQNIGYFRLTGYFNFFQNKEIDIFKNSTTFEEIINLYDFDRELRLLTLDAIERIEVSLKANMDYQMYILYGSLWYLKEDLFYLSSEINKDIYIKFIEKNSSIKEVLPSFILFEKLTMGEVSTIYKILKKENQELISSKYNVDFIDFSLRTHLLVTIRNISAHHSRLWNKEYIIKPRVQDYYFKNKFILKSKLDKTEVVPNYYNSSLIINYLMNKINKNFDWIDKLETLFIKFNNIDILQMGFNTNWKENFIK